jgi:hypothetical protein
LCHERTAHLATALYVKADDLLKASPHLARWRPVAGISPKLNDAVPVTLAMMQALLGFTAEARWLRYTRGHLRQLFPKLPLQPGYNERLPGLDGNLVAHVTAWLAPE